MGKPPASRSSTWKANEARRWRRARDRRRPSDEELALALSLWAIIECLPIEGSLGVQAKAEVVRRGIDVRSRYVDIKRIVCAKFRSAQLDPDDLIQEVMVAILRRNNTPSAYDPQKAAFSKYVFMIAKNALANCLDKQKRWDREGGVGGGEVPDLADARDPVAAFEHIEGSPRIEANRPRLSRVRILN